MLSFYKSSIKLKKTEKIFPELLSLPLHPDISKKEVDYITKTLIKILPNFIKS
jgi:dTDP-4-amino-4,6-dideoxygalactose transaminase